MKFSRIFFAATFATLLIGYLTVNPATAAVNNRERSTVSEVQRSETGLPAFDREAQRNKETREWITARLLASGW